MQKPLEVTFRGVPKIDTIEDLIAEKVAKLEKVCDYITSCQVAVEKLQPRERVGEQVEPRPADGTHGAAADPEA